MLAAACVSSAGGLEGDRGRGSIDASLPRFEHRVTGFPVADSAGRPYDHPFLGGFNVPRPQLVDIDADGDLDLFVQEAADRIAFFERLDGPAIRFEWRTDRFAGLQVGEWYRFADLDDDGDPDLLGEAKFSMIQAWENRGPVAEPRFVGVVDTLRDTSGTAIFSDRQNIPNVVDFDCDGRLDLMLGRLDGSVTRYEAVAPWEGGEAPTFVRDRRLRGHPDRRADHAQPPRRQHARVRRHRRGRRQGSHVGGLLRAGPTDPREHRVM
ncbi:MAG: hypothetical protein ACREMD_14650 [Gemmatimonadota bacterium]